MLIGMSFIPKHAWSSDRPRAILNYVENVASLKLFTIGKLRERTYAYLAAKNVKCLTRSGFGQLPFWALKNIDSLHIHTTHVCQVVENYICLTKRSWWGQGSGPESIMYSKRFAACPTFHDESKKGQNHCSLIYHLCVWQLYMSCKVRHIRFLWLMQKVSPK